MAEVEGSSPSVPTIVYRRKDCMEKISIKDQTVKLVELQKFDSEIYQYKKTLEQSPRQLDDLEEHFKSKKRRLLEIEETLKTKQLERKEKEVDLKAKEDEIAKANGQLSQLKTNKEYKAKLTEIEGHKADQSVIEEKILLLFEAIDQLNSKLENEKKILEDEEKKYKDKKNHIEEEIRDIEEKIKILENKRKQSVSEIAPQLLSRYERILTGKEGLAIVPISKGSCTGCYMNVPAQQINEIKKHEDLVYCEMCARILYIEEDL